MSRRRILLVACLAATAVVAVGGWYWCWDPVSAASYVPPESPVVLRMIGLSSGLEQSGYAEAASDWFPPIAPGLSPMDALGHECVVFVPETGSGDLVRSAVVAARLSPKAKLAEVIGALTGKCQKVLSPAGNRLRMVKIKGPGGALYYTRVGRTLIASLSNVSLDTVLRCEPNPGAVRASGGPALELKATTEGILALMNLAKSRGLLPESELTGKIEDRAEFVTEVRVRAALDNGMQLDGAINVVQGAIAEQVYRMQSGRPFAAEVMKDLPASVRLCIGTNYRLLVNEIEMGSRVMNRFVRIAAEHVGREKSFEGSFTLANVSLGGGPAGFLVMSTPKVMFPQRVETELMAKLAESVGTSAYGGQLNEGPFYRVAGAGLAGDGFVWFSGNKIVLASSEGALDWIASRMGSPSPQREDVFSEEGDLFLLANPFERVLGPVRLRFTFEKGSLKLSGRVELRAGERR